MIYVLYDILYRQYILQGPVVRRSDSAQGWKKYFIFWDRNEKWKIFFELSKQILHNLN
jgi:hypothetical protein